MCPGLSRREPFIGTEEENDHKSELNSEIAVANTAHPKHFWPLKYGIKYLSS